ncbi:uncharacterized protein LOC129947005 [Eupeodes corollae]|uniref:uncharacterized protein LOC129947005 n=1 Tax=Eupeodes corollae TaxID=290404 RepID=UPI002492E60C|nr:uncharacterized protein LOC129947005 [Eupeodes corollae]
MSTVPLPVFKSKARRCVLKCPEITHTYGFPKDEIGRSVWLKQLGLKDVMKTAAVCDKHFSAQMKTPGISNKKLTAWAIPDINLPTQILEEEVEEEEEDEDVCSDEYLLADDEGRRINESILNGFAKESEIVDEKNDDKTTKNDTNHRNESIINSDPLDFEDMIDSQNNNSKSDKGVSVEDGEFEEIFGEQALDELIHSSTSSPIMENGIDVSDEDTISVSQDPVEINSTFKRKLIACVRRRRILYDPAHLHFGNIEKKNRAWERIGKNLRLKGPACRELWLNLRYNYQNHARSLRNWLAGESNERERPRIQFENDLIFLWRFIADKSTCDDFDEVPLASSEPMVHNNSDANEPIEIDDEESQHFVGNLIAAVESYPEIYDTKHGNYGDAKRRSIIWEAISNEIKEKSTKCMFSWIQLCLRYEFELMQSKTSYLTVKMKFLEKHIIMNDKSPLKRSIWLKDEWCDPLYSCSEQHLLIAAMITSKRVRPYFANIDCPFATNDLLKVPYWHLIAKARGIKPLQCEITWIIVQMLYCELSEFRRNNCRLRDEWELESIITNLRDTIVKNRPKGPEPKKSLPLPDKSKPVASSNTFDDIEMIEDDESQFAIMPSSPSSPPPPAAPVAASVPTPPAEPAAAPPPKKNNEVIFKIPGKNPGDEERVVHYELDIPLADLRESLVVDINSVLENAHLVIITRSKMESKISLFTLEKRHELIGEVMARPIIFNEPCKTSRISRLFMGEIAKDIGYPLEACLTFWEFITEKSLFVDYDPAWKKTKDSKWIPAPYPIFDKFQKYVESKNWPEYISVLADFMQEIGNFPLIYSDLKINSSWNRRQCYVRDIAEVWAILARKFVVLENHKLIWDKFKQIFLLYMSEIELSMYNPWPPFWAPVFEKMKFLFDYKYNPKDPIYYVLRYKINEEISRVHQNSGSKLGQLDAVTNAKIIFRLLKENEYLEDFTWVNRARFISKMKSFPMLYDISHPLFGNKEAKLDAWQEMALLFHCTVGECHLIFQHLMKSFLIFRARDPNQVARVNAKYWENMTYIYSCAVPNAIDPKSIRGRSFRSSSNGSTIKLAEEYQAEISLVDAKPRLILKNFASAINSLPVQLQTSVTQHLKYIFSEYTRIQNEEIIVDV